MTEETVKEELKDVVGGKQGAEKTLPIDPKDIGDLLKPDNDAEDLVSKSKKPR